jgi:hypothetical protein
MRDKVATVTRQVAKPQAVIQNSGSLSLARSFQKRLHGSGHPQPIPDAMHMDFLHPMDSPGQSHFADFRSRTPVTVKHA